MKRLKEFELINCLNNGGVAIFSVWLTEEHYVLCTKLDEKYAYLFDPYYLNINYCDKDSSCEIIKDRPFEFNRKVERSRLDERSKKDYSFIDGKESKILIINNKIQI